MVNNTEKDSSTVKDPTSHTKRRSHVIVLHNVSEPPSRIFLSRIFLPPFLEAIREIFWSRKFCDVRYPDWEESQYLQHFRMSKDTFWYLSQMYGKYLEKETTHLRRALPQARRLAIVLHWLAQASSFAQIAALYAIGKSTVVAVIHQSIDILRGKLVPEAIRFPTVSELEQVLVDFEALCGLPCCGGALDGTFMPIKKPAEHFNAIIVLRCVDARGIFTYVNAGRPGSVGDSYTFRHSALYQKVTSGEWLAHSPQTIEGVQVNPFLVADAAFPLAATCMKYYEGSGLPPQKHSVNYSLIRTRRVVEQAFGRLKGR